MYPGKILAESLDCRRRTFNRFKLSGPYPLAVVLPVRYFQAITSMHGDFMARQRMAFPILMHNLAAKTYDATIVIPENQLTGIIHAKLESDMETTHLTTAPV